MTHPKSWPKGPVQITVWENMPGTAKGLLVRMHNEDWSYDRYCVITDSDNKASQLQMFRSLVQMCKEIAGVAPNKGKDGGDE